MLGIAERLERCRGDVLKFVAGEKAAEVEWGVGEVIIGEPTAHLSDHLEVIVDTRNDEIGEFDPYAGLFYGEDGVEHGL